MNLPYTYCITHKYSGKRYYGVRLNPVDIPEKDLFVKYFTSSEIVKVLLDVEGMSAFSVEIRKVFSSKEDAERWERKVLRRLGARSNPMWLNRATLGSSEFSEIRRKKQLEGISRAKLAKKYVGRQYGTNESDSRFLLKPKNIKIKKLLDDGLTIADISLALGVSTTTVCKVKRKSVPALCICSTPLTSKG